MMVDTQRSLAELEVLFANNTTGDISPQDARDLIASLRPSYGRISQQSNAAETVITDSVTFFPAAFSATVKHPESNDFDMPTNGNLRYTGRTDRICLITVNLSIDLGGNNIGIHLRLGKNGVDDAETEMEYHKGSANTEPEISISALLRLSTNDYVGLFIQNHTNTDNVVVDYFSMNGIGYLV